MFYNTETYNCSVDDKGRILVPAKFRKDNIDIIDQSFYLKQSNDFPCLELFPNEIWKKYMKILSNSGGFNPRLISFKLRFLSNVKEILLDKSNRILIPRDLLTESGIGKEIKMIPLTDRYQIWDIERYKKYLNETAEDSFTDITAMLDEQFRQEIKDE